MLSRYEAVLAALNAGVVIHAANTEILEANDRARSILGLRHLEGRLATDPQWVFMESDRSQMPLERFPVMQVVETGETVRGLVMIVRPPAGTEITIEVNALPVFDDSGQLDQIVVSFVDVSARADAERALATSEELLRVVLDNAGQCIMRLDQDLRVEYVNERVVALLGRPPELLIGRSLTELGYPVEGLVDWEARGQLCLETGRPEMFEYAGPEGHEVQWREACLIPQFGRDGLATSVIVTDRDITERKQTEAVLRARQAQFDAAQLVAHVGSWTLDMATDHVTWSEELYRMQGLDPKGQPPNYAEHGRLFAADSWDRLQVALRRTQETGVPYELELEMVRPDGSRGWMLARGEVVRDAGGNIVGLQGVAADVTESRHAAAALVLMATHDPLTGLANRNAMFEEISRALEASRRSRRPVAVLLLDLDHFKDVNDTLGHSAGDELLTAAAARIVSVVRASDLVARFGGDEFVVVLRELNTPSDATKSAERLLRAFRGSFALGGAELFATASIGVAIAGAASEAGDLVREADTAMYAAKAGGRDRVSVYNEDLRAAAGARLAIETGLRHALGRGELAVWYQPEVDLDSGSVVAVEALLRWHHPDGTVWSADRFIGVAEDTGLILDIGDWVLQQACVQGAAWAAGRPDRPLTVRVNVAALQLAEAGLLPAIDAALTASGLDPALLGVEITETTLLRETSAARANLNGIHDRGIGIAIDDFGTGYASLTYLNTYPIDAVKIDRSFITNGHDGHSLVAGIIALAATLNITVIAEGVEHPHQVSYLRKMGCPTAQGWLFAKALPADQITSLLDQAHFPLG